MPIDRKLAAIEYLEESCAMLKEVGVGNHWLIQPMAALFLVYKSHR